MVIKNLITLWCQGNYKNAGKMWRKQGETRLWKSRLSALTCEIVTPKKSELLYMCKSCLLSFFILDYNQETMPEVTFPVALPSTSNHWMTLDREGPLFLLHLHNKDNRFTTEFCKSIMAALQIVEDISLATDEPEDMALVTYAEGKIYSNGLDLMHAVGYPPFMENFLLMLRRMVTFCIPTVAALNGYVNVHSKRRAIYTNDVVIVTHLLADACWPWHMVMLTYSFDFQSLPNLIYDLDYRVMRSDRGYMCMVSNKQWNV